MWIAFDKNNGEGGRMGQMTGWEITRNLIQIVMVYRLIVVKSENSFFILL